MRTRKVTVVNNEEVKIDAIEPISKAQEYANKVWAGQSTDLNPRERRRRIVAALEAQGMSAEGIKIG